MGKFIDLIGQRFGRLTVLERAENKNNNTMWKCICDCGKETIVDAYYLRNGNTKSCGCYAQEIRTQIIDLIGERFGRLVVKKRVENNQQNQVQWLCQCDCGNEKIITGYNLRSGVKSCGCLQKEMVIKANKKYNTYNLSGDYGIGYTFKREEFYFDLEDYDKIKDYCWYMDEGEYIVTNDNRKIIRMHRLVMNCPNDMEVDHEFHDPWDNRKEFLRIVTRSQNAMNNKISKNNTSGVTGVNWDNQRGKWKARISINGRATHIGLFDNIKDAIKARLEAEENYYGKYRYIPK
ncbi:MAG: hypothetical protein PHX40_04625 [Bacilli bacterium]|nr:hypothetical protein [Bacilli bacterium]